MSVELYRESPGKFDSRTLNRKTLTRWTGRIHDTDTNTSSDSSDGNAAAANDDDTDTNS